MTSRVVKRSVGVVLYRQVERTRRTMELLRAQQPPSGNLPLLDKDPDLVDFNGVLCQKSFIPAVKVGQRVKVNVYYECDEPIYPLSTGDRGVTAYVLTTTEEISDIVPVGQMDRKQIDSVEEYGVDFQPETKKRKKMILGFQFRLAEMFVFARNADGVVWSKMHSAGA